MQDVKIAPARNGFIVTELWFGGDTLVFKDFAEMLEYLQKRYLP